MQYLTSDSFLIKIDNETAFTLSLSDENVVEGSRKAEIHAEMGNRDSVKPFSKPLPLASNLLAGIDDKRLAFTQGDSFIKHSGLEGGSTTANLQFLMPFVDAIKSGRQARSRSSARMLAQRDSRTSIFNAEAENAHQIYHDQMKTYAKKLAEQADQLEVGKKLILSGGWSSSGSGHAIMYIIEKTVDKTYTFTILNTGAGLDKYHSSQRVGYKRIYRPVVRLNGVDAQFLIKPDIFESLLELQISVQPDGASWEHDSGDIYERIVPALQGKRDHAFEEKVSLITAQRSGTCAWKVLMKLIQVMVESESKSRKPYKKFVFDLRSESLKAYYNRIVNRELPITDERLQLLKLSTENFARAAIKQHRAGLIEDAELSEIKSFTHIILSDIGKLPALAKAVSPLDFKFNNYSQVTLPEYLFKTHTPTTGVIDEMSRAATVSQVPEYETLPASPKELNALLQKVITSCQELQNQGLARVSMQKIIEFIKAIPENSLQPEGYWEQFCAQASKEEIEQTIGLINGASQLYFSGISLIPGN